MKYGIKEYACTAVDMISRRTRLAFLNVQAAEEALPKIVELMGRELNWSELRKQVSYKSLSNYRSVDKHVSAWAAKAPITWGDGFRFPANFSIIHIQYSQVIRKVERYSYAKISLLYKSRRCS